ncbi:hypothetical protein CSB93_0596 [Pseudomonas paraeruginosa]|uniref:Uncharacterized protein n=1 Tax=Pseudomonas paraeruginosa TaxID=2994495 RepID=A0A2R3J1X6_9PSED|nr:hypothetical protein CSB93_0596 [Pseudomonas paraeruginosa]
MGFVFHFGDIEFHFLAAKFVRPCAPMYNGLPLPVENSPHERVTGEVDD